VYRGLVLAVARALARALGFCALRGLAFWRARILSRHHTHRPAVKQYKAPFLPPSVAGFAGQPSSVLFWLLFLHRVSKPLFISVFFLKLIDKYDSFRKVVVNSSEKAFRVKGISAKEAFKRGKVAFDVRDELREY
jgi:hypothetical protein